MNSPITAIPVAITLCLVFLTISAQAETESKTTEQPIMLEDFIGDPAERWYTVNDNVMGGRSSGGPSFADGILTFAGSIDTNGGGFSSIRSAPDPHDLSKQMGLLLRVKGDGRTYEISIYTNARYRDSLVRFRADVKTVAEEWVEIFVPFDSLNGSWRGQRINPQPELDLSQMRSMGLMLTDGQDGPFELQVDWIQAVPSTPEPPETETE